MYYLVIKKGIKNSKIIINSIKLYMVMVMINKCQLCHKFIENEALVLVAGFPEREHKFCSKQCFSHFLRMEDDELQFADFLLKERGKKKKGGR